MCRLAVYAGPSVPLATLLYEPPRSLQRLAYDPREQLYGHVNVDGTGVAWWPDLHDEPLRYVTPSPPWSDPNLPSLARRLDAPVQLAAVRGATPGIPFGPANVAPFVLEGVAFAHNGWLGAFREGTGRALTDQLPDDLYGQMDTVSDSLVVFLTLLAQRREQPELAAAVEATVERIDRAVRTHDTVATLNLAVVDGDSIVATRSSIEDDVNSLYVARDAERWPDAVVIASEPLDDDPAWEEVPEHHLVHVDVGTRDVELRALADRAGAR